MYNGNLHKHNEVETYKTSKISVEVVQGEKPYIQADGELLGQGDFTVKIIPRAIHFIVPN